MPDDLVWVVQWSDHPEVSEVSGYLFVAASDECVIVSSDPSEPISEYLINETQADESMFGVCAFRHSDVFATQEEANKALAELQGNLGGD